MTTDRDFWWVPSRLVLLCFALLVLVVFLVASSGCATAPEIKTDNVKDGTVVCASITGIYGTGKSVVAKLEERVIRDGGSVKVDANCVIDIQLLAPQPKPTPGAPPK